MDHKHDQEKVLMIKKMVHFLGKTRDDMKFEGDIDELREIWGSIWHNTGLVL